MAGSAKGWRGTGWRAGLLALGVLAATLIAVAGSSAQEQRKSRNLFEFLFGGRERAQPLRQNTRPAARPRNRATPAPATGQAAEQPAPAAIEKSETAKVVLVVGDFMASGLADALAEAFADDPDVRIVDRTKGSSGFVRDDVFDWPAGIGGLVDEEKPAAVVAMIGSNDRQQMKVGDTRETLLSENWLKEYQTRAETFAGNIHSRKVPLVWIGQPAFKFKSMLSDMLVFNDIYRKTTDSVGGAFVDIWDGFVDENGAFVYSGPDVNGQPVRLRADDGINMTLAGKRKVAFYAEKPLRKALGLHAPGTAAPGIAIIPGAGAEGGSAAPVDRTLPVSLNDFRIDGNTELLGATTEPRGEPRSPVEKLTIEGIAPPPPPGRADDFDASGRAALLPSAHPGEADTTTAITP